VATGYDSKSNQQQQDPSNMTPRLAIEEVVFSDTFGVPYQSLDDKEDLTEPAAATSWEINERKEQNENDKHKIIITIDSSFIFVVSWDHNTYQVSSPSTLDFFC